MSDQFFASLSPGPASDPLLRKVTVSQVCGNEVYQYNWHGDPTAAFLVGDDGLLLAGSSFSKESRHNTFVPCHDQVANHIETSADGKILVVAVKTFGGGNGRLDISQHLKAERLAIYDSTSGERIKVISVTPIATFNFWFFRGRGRASPRLSCGRSRRNCFDPITPRVGRCQVRKVGRSPCRKAN